MKRFWAALSGLLIAATAHAQTATSWGQSSRGITQTSIVGGFNPIDTTGVPLQFDSNGNLRVSEAFPASSFTLIKPSVLSTGFFHIPGVIGSGASASWAGYTVADSSAPVYVQGYSRLALLLYPQVVSSAADGKAADSILASVIGLSWRLHTSGTADTSNTFTELVWNRNPNHTSVPAAGDTNYFRSDSVGTTMPSMHSLVMGSGGAGISLDDTKLQPNEVALCINATNPRVTTGVGPRFPRGRIVYLTTHDGQPVQAQWISFYWRAVATYLNNTSFTVASAAQEVKLRVRADLVGWR